MTHFPLKNYNPLLEVSVSVSLKILSGLINQQVSLGLAEHFLAVRINVCSKRCLKDIVSGQGSNPRQAMGLPYTTTHVDI